MICIQNQGAFSEPRVKIYVSIYSYSWEAVTLQQETRPGNLASDQTLFCY
jgi:hypothetical protein